MFQKFQLPTPVGRRDRVAVLRRSLAWHFTTLVVLAQRRLAGFFQCQKLYDKWDSIAIMDTVCVCILYIYKYNIYILGILTNKMNMSISSGFTCLVF